MQLIPDVRFKEGTMIIVGTIKSYDETRGIGAIAPDIGREIIRFRRNALPKDEDRPHERERFSYEVEKDAFGNNCAVKLHRVQAE